MAPSFFGRDDSHFLWQIVSAHRRNQDFQGWVRPGVDLVRVTMEGPKAPNEARSAGAPRGWGLRRGAVAPPTYGVLSLIHI